MLFWIRHAFLVLACVLLPLVAALYYDTQSEVRRAQQTAALAAQFAADNLETRLTLDAHDAVNAAITLAQRIVDRDLVGQEAAKPKDAAKAKERQEATIAGLTEMLRAAAPPGGFAWYIDESGTVAAGAGVKTIEGTRRISGHPLFIDTQEGFALDAMWREGNDVHFVGAAPVVVRGQSSGAVFLGAPLNRELLDRIAKGINTAVTVVRGDQVMVTTLEPGLADVIVTAVGTQEEPVAAGFMSQPIRPERIPFLPLFLSKNAEGSAYSSLGIRVAGAGDLRWILSAPTDALLREVPGRQEIVLGGAGVCVLLALLIGMINFRTFVAPLGRITDHLSDVNFGRGELELAETRVSKPFRRLVKLINMTVQKVPTRGFSGGRSDLEGVSQPASPARDSLLRFDAISRSEPRSEVVEKSPAASLDSRNSSPLSMEDFLDANKGAEESPPPQRASKESDDSTAIAAAIASIEGRSKPQMGSQASARAANMTSLSAGKAPTRVRSAADIRGVPSESLATPVVAEPPKAVPNVSLSSAELVTEASPSEAPASGGLLANFRPKTSSRGGGSLEGGLLASAGFEDRSDFGSPDSFNPEETVVSPVTDELLRKSASRDELTSQFRLQKNPANIDATAVAAASPSLIAQTMGGDEAVDMSGLDPSDHAHFKETYERFIEMRRRCGEPTSDLAFDRFLVKLAKNREGLVKKYNCRTVRFQVYEKDGKAALKATPVRAR